MKALLLLWVVISVARAGEISDRFYKESKARSEALEKETDPKKRREWRTEATLSFMNPTEFENNGFKEWSFGPISTNHGITEIGIERTGCLGTCPAYTFIVTGDGKCRYEGGTHAKISGKKTGIVSLVGFHRIAELARQFEVGKLKDSYNSLVTDSPTTFTTFVLSGQRKTIRNYASAGPTQLWAIEELLDQMLNRVQWDKKRKRN